MKCPKCQFENEERSKFCLECGQRLELECPQCGKILPLLAKFCNQCGQRLEEVAEAEKQVAEAEGERKYVTVLFSDLSGYTAMSEKLDPEEVKEITSRIFGNISEVIGKYQGFIEKFVGDAVMALFGAPKGHEDDPVRAIRAAREIHELVDALSPEMEKRIGRPISMHTGINTGLVVTGEVDMEKGTHGVAGDTINLASRLSSLAQAGEVLVDADTCRQAEGHFIFEALEPTMVKGKAEPIQAYRFLSPKERPVTIHRLSGLRAALVGRKAEVAQLREAVEKVREGKGSLFSICGGAGTGKSRLVEDFKATLDLEEIQWLEGHAYPYSQNIPYYPLIDLLNRVFLINEGDSQEKVREKVESGVGNLIGKKENLVPYLGTLYSLRYPEVEEVSPEFWRSRLQEAIQTIISALARSAPTVFLLEDLHWADPSFVDLLRHTLLDVRQPAIVLCIYRPVFTLFTSQQVSGLAKVYHEIRLQDLSLSEAQDMLESLLQTGSIPSDLKRFVQERAEGNPFYLEELVNSLIESETLIRDNGGWKFTRSISESDISPTIHGLISGRLDRLEKETKRILQKASVIGRAFLYEILRRVTEIDERIDRGLSTLERLDFIRTRSLEPDLEYMFKHPLTQEVVYNGLLKKERQAIHEQIGIVMEQLFHDRLPEFFEILAFHFTRGRSAHKAVNYLMRSGEKSLARYAVQESHEYYKEAYDLIADKQTGTEEKRDLLFELLNKWSLVYYYRGDFKGQTDLLKRHEKEADLVHDQGIKGMFYAWLGFNLQFRWEIEASYRYLQKALKIGEEANNQRVIGYACTWLVYACAVCDKYEEGHFFWERAVGIAESLKSDQYLYFKSMAGIAHLNSFSGEKSRSFEIGNTLLQYGERHSNIRSQVVGYLCVGHSHFADGDLTKAISCYQKALVVTQDPFYAVWPRLYVGLCYFLNKQLAESEEMLSAVISYMHNFGCEIFSPAVVPIFGIISINKGEMSQGLKMIEDIRNSSIKKNWGYGIAMSEYVLGNLYFQMAYGERPGNLSIIKNIGFLAKNVPFASKKAEEFLSKAVESAKRFGAKGIQGSASMDLGNLYRIRKRNAQARGCISEAVHVFEEIKAEVYLKKAREALDGLERGGGHC
ncbi:MAG: adenylate/guanylate cyclase domain-containing protein [Pseudomonadota bacterium]